MADLHKHISDEFRLEFGEAPKFIVRAPGRVNLIGEHTDYNLGFALPMAIDRAIWIALRPRADRRVQLKSLGFAEPAEMDLDHLQHSGGWSDYVQGMAWALAAEGYPLTGWEGVLVSDVPVGSGLSSSAAIEMAVARAFWSLDRWDWHSVSMAKVARRHENEWMGVKSGIMDQMISAIGEKDTAFRIDFRDLTFDPCPMPGEDVVVVLDTKVKRGLVESAYNRRVAECGSAAAYFGKESLRDVDIEDFRRNADDLDPVLRKRARHVIAENERVNQAVLKLRRGDSEGFGALMLESHASLRDDYEVSCGELDLMVELSMAQTGCYGARMTGAGFGGCAIALTASEKVDEFCENVAADYEQRTGLKPEIYVCRASNGAELLPD